MNLKKYIYVSPQYYVKVLREWNYEYISHGEFKRTHTFGYHQGKDIIKNLEIEAWRTNRKVRMLTQFQWRDLRYTLLGGKYTTEDGSKIVFHSKAQFEKFIKESERPEYQTKTLRQLNSGEIILQHVFEDEGRYLGFLTIIGTRGGVRTEHDFRVGFADGEPYLTRRIGSLFD
jgi:hypothetical protein